MPRSSARQSKKEPAFSIRPKHHAILEQIYKYQLLTNEQIGRAVGYAEKSIEEVQRLTKQLSNNDYVLVLIQPVVFGRAPYVYTLSRKGLNYLKDAGFDVRDYFRPSQEAEKGYLFLQHTLSLNDFLISAANLYKFAPFYSLHSFIHERTLKQTPFKVKVLRNAGGILKEETVTLIPDAYLDFRHVKESGKEEKIPVLLELDRCKFWN